MGEMNLQEASCRQCGLPVAAIDAFCATCGAPVPPATGVRPSPQQATAARAGLPLPPAAPWPPGPQAPPAWQDQDGRGAAPDDGSWAAEPPAPRPRWPGDGSTAGQQRHQAASGEGTGAGAPLGHGTTNEAYLGERLLYDKEAEQAFDPLANRSVWVQITLRARVYLLVYAIAGGVSGFVLSILGFVGLGFVAAFIWIAGGFLAGLVLAGLFLLIPVPALLSEWKFSVDGKAAAAGAAFEHINWAINRHETPLDWHGIRRLHLAGGQARDYLELRSKLFTGFIACFAYGQDLYVGWTFWLQLSPLRLVLMRWARLVETLSHRGSELYVTLRFDYARAMREAMHSVAREGVEVAIGELRAQGQGSLAHTPVSETEAGADG